MVVNAPDPLYREGLRRLLDAYPGLRIGERHGDVLVVAAELLTADVVGMLRLHAVENATPVVLVLGEPGADEALADCRVMAVLSPHALTADVLGRAVLDALNGTVRAGVPDGDGGPAFTERELDVLRLLAEGLETDEIAVKLAYSERTVKNVIHGINHRYGLRNRSHAVAFALRTGVI